MTQKELRPRRHHGTDRFSDRLRKRRASLSPSLLNVLDYIDGNRHAVLGKSALEIGFAAGTSDATVIRAIQTLGFQGLVDLKDTLEAWLGETDSPVEKLASTATEIGRNTDAAIDFVIADQSHAIQAMSTDRNRAAMAKAVGLLRGARRIGLFGMQASGILASYAARIFQRHGFPSYALNASGILLAEELLEMQSGDVLVMLAQSRAHRESQTVIAEAQRLSVPIIMLLGREDSVLCKDAAVVLIVPRAKRDQFALHAPALVTLEAMALALASVEPDRTLASLQRLVDLRGQIRPTRR
ncbi:MurR/RpiR family transcriptional regulator [Paracoccus sp. M683]|uniref:MurR/RpiR family transcriptional regulator n=1 Tax=Paracoccus sp. M683 TaxID=2594268 RepID=UPI00117E95EF|nr:MurR/RpiR family transcriptional regulator [Paracoccus sp. M683]TRW99379.1 MurR/RpiR family transcriptional regulator [Paracoccus sp. M683]